MEVFIFVIVGWIFSVCLHEFGHAVVAYRFGDYTVKEKGYLEMNPLHYAHPVYSFVVPIVILLLGGIGLPGGAVYIQDALIRFKWQRAMVSLAGPAMNVVLVLLLCVPFWTGLLPGEGRELLSAALALLIQLQIMAILFNLLPMPPLDGWGIVSQWVSQATREFAVRYTNQFFMGLFLLFWMVRGVSEAFWFVVYAITSALGIDTGLASAGWREFHSWRSAF